MPLISVWSWSWATPTCYDTAPSEVACDADMAGDRFCAGPSSLPVSGVDNEAGTHSSMGPCGYVFEGQQNTWEKCGHSVAVVNEDCPTNPPPPGGES